MVSKKSPVQTWVVAPFFIWLGSIAANASGCLPDYRGFESHPSRQENNFLKGDYILSKGILNSYSDIAFANIVKCSDSYKDCARKLGYKACSGDTLKLIKGRIESLNIDVSHFYQKNKKVRTVENVFLRK